MEIITLLLIEVLICRVFYHEMKQKLKTADLIIGLKIGNLEIISKPTKRAKKGCNYDCQCLCGNKLIMSNEQLTHLKFPSCGCVKRISHRRKYDLPSPEIPEYNTWIGMKRRCAGTCGGHSDIRYAGRGIKVCERWENSFENFYEDMGPRPSPKHSIDRIDNDGNYSPENCRWALNKQQANNRSSNKFFTMNGETLTIPQWCEKLNLHKGTVQSRIQRGHSFEEAIKPTEKPRTKPETHLLWKGENLSWREWEGRTKIKASEIRKRLGRGWPVDKALTQPMRGRTN